MKKHGAFILLAYFLSLPVLASVMDTKIVDLEEGDKSGEEIMVFTESGRVLWLNPLDTEMREAFRQMAASNQRARVHYDEQSGKLLGAGLAAGIEEEEEDYELAASFEPTVIPDLPSAQLAFDSMDKRTKSDSQCFNRAHGWAYDLHRTRGISTNKLFLFFTSKYIRAYRYHWWFHVTPTTFLQMPDGSVAEHTLDRSFTKGPMDVRSWTNIFMKNAAECRPVALYSQYRNNQSIEWCYLIRSSMFYRTPSDLELYERNGRQETQWITSELRLARRQAFIYWRDYDI